MMNSIIFVLVSFAFASTNFYKDDFFNFSYKSKEYSCTVKLATPYYGVRGYNPSKELGFRKNFRIKTDVEDRVPFIASVIRDESVKLSQNDRKCLYTIWLRDTLLTFKTNNQLVENLYLFSKLFTQKVYEEKIHKDLLHQIFSKELVTLDNLYKVDELKDKNEAKFVFDIIKKYKITSRFPRKYNDFFISTSDSPQSLTWMNKFFLNEYDFKKERDVILNNKKIQSVGSNSEEGKAYEFLFNNISLNGNDNFLRELINDDDWAHRKVMYLIIDNYLLESIGNSVFKKEKCTLYKKIFDRVNEVFPSYDEKKALAEFSKVKEPCVQEMVSKK